MERKWLALAGELLDRASDEFSDHGCNDWRWPAGWSADDRRELAVAMVAHNVRRDPPAFTDEDRAEVEELIGRDHGPPDWWVMTFLAAALRAESKHKPR